MRVQITTTVEQLPHGRPRTLWQKVYDPASEKRAMSACRSGCPALTSHLSSRLNLFSSAEIKKLKSAANAPTDSTYVRRG